MPLLAAGLLLIPMAMLLVSASRLQSHIRDRRVAALRLVGLPPSHVRVVGGVETVAAVAATGRHVDMTALRR